MGSRLVRTPRNKRRRGGRGRAASFPFVVGRRDLPRADARGEAVREMQAKPSQRAMCWSGLAHAGSAHRQRQAATRTQHSSSLNQYHHPRPLDHHNQHTTITVSTLSLSLDHLRRTHTILILDPHSIDRILSL